LSTSRAGAGWSPFLTIVVVLTCIGLVTSVPMLYRQHERSREALSTSARTSGWHAYQTQLEVVKAIGAIELALVDPSASRLSDARLRLAILRSRLPLLNRTEGNGALPGIERWREDLVAFGRMLDSYLDSGGLEAPAPGIRAALEAVRADLDAVQSTVQEIERAWITYQIGLHERELDIAENPKVLPGALLILSGLMLIIFLLVETVRGRRRLRAMTAAEEEAASARQNMRALIEATPALIVVYDPETLKISFINSFALALIHPSPDHQDWERFVTTARSALPACSVDAPWGAFSFQRSDGTLLALRGRTRPLVWEDRDQCALILGDTTQLRDAEYQILQAAKLSTLGEMASAIAHEINQPLTVIRMAAANSRRLLENGDAPALAAKLSRIDQQVERAKQIIDQVRRYGRKPSLRSERFPLARTIDLAISFVAEQLRMANIRFVMDIDLPEDLVVEGEQTLFEQVIVNLLLNAKDAFEMQADEGAARERTITIRARVEADRIRIEVLDRAGGIPEAIIGEVFEPFTTTKPDDKGTGLGLSLSRNIVRKMSGDISVLNVDGGACFTIDLPKARRSLDDKVVA